MNNFDWDKLMKEWNTYVFHSKRSMQFDLDLIKKGWMGFKGATEKEIEILEERLNSRLPESYRSFLAYSNGWHGILNPFIDKLFNTSEIGWFRDLNSEWLEIELEIAEEFKDMAISAEQHIKWQDENEGIYHAPYLKDCLQISAVGNHNSSVFLLNPSVLSGTGEWEAWFLASWLPGARRYMSFWEMMKREFDVLKSVDEMNNLNLV